MSAPTPRFGQWIRNVQASEHNPHRDGAFVRVVQRGRSRMNPGVWWEITDGEGEFWQIRPANGLRIATPSRGRST